VITTSETINELTAALALAQSEIKGASKDSTNPHFNSRYADLASVREAMIGPFTKHGLSVVQSPRLALDEAGTVVEVETRVFHKSGQWMADTLGVPISKVDAQGVGSAITYGRRYALAAFAGVAPEDDDAEGAVGRPAQPARETVSRATGEIRPGASCVVVGVSEKPTRNGGLQFAVKFSDGGNYSTFDESIGMLAHQLKESGEPVTYQTVKKGAYTNLISLNRVKSAAADEDEIPLPDDFMAPL
jgi:hypothetical protein